MSKIKLNEGHYVEAIDRTYIVANFIETTLLGHPVFQKHLKIKKKTEKAEQLILEIYQELNVFAETDFPSQPQRSDNESNPEVQ